MISLQNLALRHGQNLLFSGANIQIHPGWKVGLTGVNGAGKSSLFALFKHILHPDTGDMSIPSAWMISHMAQEVESSDTSALDFVLSGDAEYWQLNAQINRSDLDDMAYAEALQKFDEIGGYTAQSRAATILAGLGVHDSKHGIDVASFSGGWRMRINLARALMCRSDLLLLDEPTNHLDLDAILWLEQWLSSYKGTLVMISHDRDFLDAICDHILHIENKQLTLYTGNYSDFERMRAERLAQQQQAYEKQEAVKAHMQKYIDRFRAQATKAKQAQSRIKQLERMQTLLPAHIDSPFTFKFLDPKQTASPLLTFSDVDIGYRKDGNDICILKQVNFQITPDTRIGLLGLNGAGKSTLIKALVGEEPLLTGERIVSEHLKIGYFAQHQMDALDGNASPMLLIKRLADKNIHEATIRAFIGGFAFSGERMDTPCEHFSGGERARLALALIVWQRPNVLILDEPTNHLDLEMRSSLCMAIQNYQGAVVLVSHDRQLMNMVCDQFYLVHMGKCAEFDNDLEGYAQWLRQARQDVIKHEKASYKQQASQSTQPATTPVATATLTASNTSTNTSANSNDSVNKGIDNVSSTASSSATNEPVLSYAEREAAKKQAAQRRAQSAPLRSKITKQEAQLTTLNQALQHVINQLADESIYDVANKQQLKTLLAQQIELQANINTLEEQLLQDMDTLEQLTTGA